MSEDAFDEINETEMINNSNDESSFEEIEYNQSSPILNYNSDSSNSTNEDMNYQMC